MDNDLNIVKKIKELEKRIDDLQTRLIITKLRFDANGVFVVPNGPTTPATGIPGQLFYNTTSSHFLIYTTSNTWVRVKDH